MAYQNGILHIEDVAVDQIANQVGTPVYVYSQQALTQNFESFVQAVQPLKKATICFAVKSNANLSVLKVLADLGAGADIVSGLEMELALTAGIPADKIVYSGVGKTRLELMAAIQAGIKQINAESESEVLMINEIAQELGVVAAVGLRINPDVDAKTHAKITTGKKENKFGIDWIEAQSLFTKFADLKGVSLHGIEVHVGSQLLDLEPFREAFVKTAEMIQTLIQQGIEIRTIDVGGGIGVQYRPSETAPKLTDYIAILQETLGSFGAEFVFEPGRCIVGNAGWLVSRVVRTKKTGQKEFVIVDAGMNDLIRPAIYDAYHGILAVKQAEKTKRYDVVGPICESSDVFAKDRSLPEFKADDLLVFETAGAYGSTMSSTYNCRPLAPEVLVNGHQFAVVRQRQTLSDMLKLYHSAPWLAV